MCGRARLSSDVSEIKIAFGIPLERPAPNFAASWNVAPTDPLPVVRYDPNEHQRSLDVMRWGLIPYWAKDIKIGFSTINARAEEIDTKPAFREAFGQRRCLVPLDNFYEWAEDPDRQAALRDRAQGRRADGHGRAMGDLALARRRTDPQLHDRDHDAERIVRQASQPDARGAEARGVADVARRGAGRSAASEGAAGPLPFRGHDLLAGQRARRQRQEQRSGADRADYSAVILPPDGVLSPPPASFSRILMRLHRRHKKIMNRFLQTAIRRLHFAYDFAFVSRFKFQIFRRVPFVPSD